MSLDDLHGRAEEASATMAAHIEALALVSFRRVWTALLRGDETPVRELILRELAAFDGEYMDQLAAAFSAMLARTVSVTRVMSMPVGDVVLSRRLYLHAVETAAEVAAIVRSHAAGVTQARELLLALYDGYSPQDGIRRPLEGRARASLPKELRQVTSEPRAGRELSALFVRAQKQAARLKSPALRAAYTEALTAWEAGAGREALRKRLDVAYREKSRFMADRIAQTELARAYQAKVAGELMRDPESFPVQVRLNPAHPRKDICDLHARADVFGMGPGIYPKARAPRPPFHPYCWCRVRPRQDLGDLRGQERIGAHADLLRREGERDAALIMGSRERADRVIGGTPAEDVVNAGKATEHRLMRVGDPAAQRHHVVT